MIVADYPDKRTEWLPFSLVRRTTDNKHIYALDPVFPLTARSWELRIYTYLEPNWHNYAEIALIEEGTGLSRIGKDLYALEPGDVVVIAPEVKHTFWSGPRSSIRFRAFYFLPELVAPAGSGPLHHRYVSLFTRRGPNRPLKHGTDDRRLADSIRRCCRLNMGPGSEENRLEMLSELYRILSRLNRLAPVGRPGLQERKNMERWEGILRLVNRDPSEWPSLEAVAAAVGMSRWGFCRFFKRESGLPWTAWLRCRAIDRARDLLADTDLPVVRIAMEVGFSNLSWFNRCFREITGSSPSRYRTTSVSSGED